MYWNEEDWEVFREDQQYGFILPKFEMYIRYSSEDAELTIGYLNLDFRGHGIQCQGTGTDHQGVMCPDWALEHFCV